MKSPGQSQGGVSRHGVRARVCDAAHDAEARLWREVYVSDEARERDEARHKKDVEEIKSMSASQVTWSDFRIAFPSNVN